MPNSETPIRVLLADDHTMLREGLHRSLSLQGLQVVAEAADGQSAVELAEVHRPDVVLMDVTMPVLGGIPAARRIREKVPEAAVIMLTMHADIELANEARAAGAAGYLIKDCTTEDIVSAIRLAVDGGKTFTGLDDDRGEVVGSKVLTARETEVLQLIADGRSTVDAAAALYVSVKTVKNHLASAYSKLEAHDRTQAVLRAARLGLITLKG